ncbi:MAG: hypothetical protein FWG07_08895 [Treponema sp.]|nr:hypothetical protein [Treponema sp.]
MNKEVWFILMVVLSFTGCLASDSELFVDYSVYTPVNYNDFWSITDHDIYINFIRYSGHKDTKIETVVRSNQRHKIFKIKELSFEFDDGVKGYFLRNAESKIPQMNYYELEGDGVGYYYSSAKGNEPYFIGKFNGEELFKDSIHVGEKKEIKVMLIYSFDNEPLKRENYTTFTVNCLERNTEDHWIFRRLFPCAYW